MPKFIHSMDATNIQLLIKIFKDKNKIKIKIKIRI